MASVDVLQGHLREEITRHLPWSAHVSGWISEHVVRGVTTRLAALKVSCEEANIALAREVQWYPYVGEVAERLLEFEGDRRRYPDLDRFYPRLVDLFDEIAHRESSIRG